MRWWLVTHETTSPRSSSPGDHQKLTGGGSRAYKGVPTTPSTISIDRLTTEYGWRNRNERCTFQTLRKCEVVVSFSGESLARRGLWRNSEHSSDGLFAEGVLGGALYRGGFRMVLHPGCPETRTRESSWTYPSLRRPGDRMWRCPLALGTNSLHALPLRLLLLIHSLGLR